MSTEQEPQDGEEKTFNAYSDYRAVTSDIHRAVADAVDAYAYLRSHQREGAAMDPDRVAECRGAILSAALRLLPEMKRESHRDEIEEMLDEWRGDDDGQGNLDKFADVDLYNTAPAWIGEWVQEIRRAAFILGYLQAGSIENDSKRDVDVKQTESMFEDI